MKIFKCFKIQCGRYLDLTLYVNTTIEREQGLKNKKTKFLKEKKVKQTKEIFFIVGNYGR